MMGTCIRVRFGAVGLYGDNIIGTLYGYKVVGLYRVVGSYRVVGLSSYTSKICDV